MNDKICFTSVAITSKNYGDGYIKQQSRLMASIMDVYGDEAMSFHWTDRYPPGSRDWLASSYGFKPWAVQYALDQGYTKICYMDTAMILEKKLDLDYLVGEYGVIAAKDDSKLSDVTWDRALEYFGLVRGWLEGKTLVGGSFYYFDMANEKCRTIFKAWKRAEEAGMFGSQEGESAGIQNGHRADETCMSIVMHMNGSKPCSYEQIGYQGETMRKEHFR